MNIILKYYTSGLKNHTLFVLTSVIHVWYHKVILNEKTLKVRRPRLWGEAVCSVLKNSRIAGVSVLRLRLKNRCKI